MTPGQRQELWGLMQQMMGDPQLAQELAELSQHLYQEIPDFGQPYQFSGQEELPLEQALEQMDRLSRLDQLEQQLERHGPDEPVVRLSVTDDVFLRSYTWARVQLGIPLPVEG